MASSVSVCVCVAKKKSWRKWKERINKGKAWVTQPSINARMMNLHQRCVSIFVFFSRFGIANTLANVSIRRSSFCVSFPIWSCDARVLDFFAPRLFLSPAVDMAVWLHLQFSKCVRVHHIGRRRQCFAHASPRPLCAPL